MKYSFTNLFNNLRYLPTYMAQLFILHLYSSRLSVNIIDFIFVL